MVTARGFGKGIFFMGDDGIKPEYKVVSESEMFGIFGEEKTTGETVLIKQISKERETSACLAEILNENKVSVHHAKDVLKDLLVEPLL